MTQTDPLTPPRYRPAFHVGVTGHRDLDGADTEHLHATITAILAAVADAVAASVASTGDDLFATPVPYLRCVCSLAEGADQLVAARARGLGFTLQCPLPFPREQYLTDFVSTGPREAFTALLADAEAVLELNGTHDDAPDAYLAGGRVVLDQSDLLLAIWDGAPARGVGGPAQIVAEAKARGLPVIIIDANPPHDVQLCPPVSPGHPAARPITDWRAHLSDQVRAVLVLPETDPAGASPRAELRRYLAETVQPPPWYGRLAATLEGWLLPAPAPPATATNAAATSAATPDMTDRLPPDRAPPDRAPLERAMYCADKTAIYYGGLHRSFVLLRYLLLLPAALGACIAFYLPEYLPLTGVRTVGFLLQAASLGSILLLAGLNRKHHWLARFTDDRLLAELLRHQCYLGALGRALPVLRRPPHRPDAAATWVGWYLRAAMRAAGLPTDRLTPSRLLRLRDAIRGVLEQQRTYHTATATRCAILARRLERIGSWSYRLGLAAVLLRPVAFLLVEARDANAIPAPALTWLNIASLALPALAPVVLGLRSQAEYARLAAQSRAMAEELRALLPALDGETPPTHDQLCAVAETAARIMVREASDWRLAIKARPLSAT